MLIMCTCIIPMTPRQQLPLTGRNLELDLEFTGPYSAKRKQQPKNLKINISSLGRISINSTKSFKMYLHEANIISLNGGNYVVLSGWFHRLFSGDSARYHTQIPSPPIRAAPEDGAAGIWDRIWDGGEQICSIAGFAAPTMRWMHRKIKLLAVAVLQLVLIQPQWK